MTTILTNLTRPVDLTIMESVIGQLSDGMWENSRTAEGYWPYVDVKMVNGKVAIDIDDASYCRHLTKQPNQFRFKLGMDSTKIKQFFAKKAKALIKAEAKNYPERYIKCKKDCDTRSIYLSRENEVTGADVKEFINVIMN